MRGGRPVRPAQGARGGYAGGTTDNPTYYSIGDHSETIQIDYDPDFVTYLELLDVSWGSHTPSTRCFSRQYRSIIFFHNEQQPRLALDTKEREEAGKSVFTEILPFEEDFTNSTVTARLNGYIGGFGSEDQLEQELESFSLSDQAEKYLRERVSRR